MWADAYVGLPFKRMGRARTGLDCWGLVRLVLVEQAGIIFPAYTEDDPDGWSIESHAIAHMRVTQPRELDVAILFTPVRAGLTWRQAPCHIGVYVNAEQVLHIEEGHCSRVQPANELHLHSIARVN